MILKEIRDVMTTASAIQVLKYSQIRKKSGILLSSSDVPVVAKSTYYWNLYTLGLLDTITLLGQ